MYDEKSSVNRLLASNMQSHQRYIIEEEVPSEEIGGHGTKAKGK